MSIYWSDLANNIEPYLYGEQPQNKEYIKLNTNENPYPPSKKVINSINNIDKSKLRLYPDPTCKELRKSIASYYNVNPQQIFIGNGSSEVLVFSFLAFFNRNDKVILPDITYSFYEVCINLFQLETILVNLNEEFTIPMDELNQPARGIIIPNPNAPTGKGIEIEAVEKILKNNKEKIVIIDEAYIDFGGKTSVELIKEYVNLLVIQSFSKSRSLAGMRIGFAVGQEELIEGLNKIKNSINSYTIDRIEMVAAQEAIMDRDHFETTRNKIIKTREKIVKELKQLGFEIIPSQANFILITHNKFKAEKLYEELKRRGILVRYFNKPKISNYLRVSIGTEKEMAELIKKLKCIL